MIIMCNCDCSKERKEKPVNAAYKVQHINVDTGAVLKEQIETGAVGTVVSMRHVTATTEVENK